jgi:AcrR family transcriptional regulator
VLRPTASSRRSRNRVSVEQRRVEILEATRGVVLEKGFGGTRIKDVSDALGVSTGLVHYHFASKDELLAETMRYAADADIRRLEKTVAAGSDPIERLDRVLREYLPGPRDQSWTLWIDAWGEALRSPTLREISEELDQAWIGLLERVIRDGVTAKVFRTSDPAGSAWRLAALMDGLGLQVVLHKGTMSRARMLEHTRSVAAAELGLRRDDFPSRR